MRCSARCLVVCCLAFAFVASLATPASAAITLIGEDEDGEEKPFKLELGGYAQSVSGVQHIGYDTAGLIPENTGISSGVLRLEWLAQYKRDLVLEVHNRLFWQVTSAGAVGDFRGPIGLGSSAPPDRTVDLSSNILDESGLLVEHDIDRLALRYFGDSVEMTLGRQAISWGKSLVFPVADLWSQFSPYELDQSQKRGIDAARLIAYPSFTSEIDFIVADRGSVDDLSGGVRYGQTIDRFDFYVAGGKFWNEILAMAGFVVDVTAVKLRAEVTEPFNLDDGELELPRATAGLDWLSTDYQVAVEYHFNGAGRDDPDEYVDQLESEVFTRGESYYLGRHYGGVLASYSGVDRLKFSLSAAANLTDPSFILTPSIYYDLADNADISFGAFQSFGEEPEIAIPNVELGSEYGTYGSFYFTQLRGFF